ncbi:hypothetical protein Hanom_Chr09g00847641 [Helianthus anomalus]
MTHSKWILSPLMDLDGPTGMRGRSKKKTIKTSKLGNFTTSTDGLLNNIININLNDDPTEDTIPTKLQRIKRVRLSTSKGKEGWVDAMTEFKLANMLELEENTEKHNKLVESKLKRDVMKHL